MPVYKAGDTLLAQRYWVNLKKNDIVILIHPETKRLLLKRIKRIRTYDRKEYFVLGDNEHESTDSRDFGWVEKKDIIGKVLQNLLH